MSSENSTEKSTEIRSEEKSRGGICYEMILAEPITDKPEPSPVRSKTLVTAEDINTKLNQAEERRKSFEASRLASINDRLSKLEEVAKKREESNLALIMASQAALEEKLDTASTKREEYLNEFKTKISDQLSKLEEAAKKREESNLAFIMASQAALEEKLDTTSTKREEYLNDIKTKISEHDRKLQEAAKKREESNLAFIMASQATLKEKLDTTSTNREEYLNDLKTKISEHDRKAEVVRANKERLLAAEENGL